MNRTLFILFLSTLTLFGCDEAQVGELEIIPLKVGNSWTYEWKSYSNGQLDSTVSVTNKVLDSISSDTTTWFKIREFGDPFYIRNASLGQYEMIPDSFSISGKPYQQLFFPYPVTNDSSFKINDGTGVMYSNHAQVETGCPAGKYMCLEYMLQDVEDDQNYIHYFVHPGIGIVKYERKTDDRIEIAELVSWKLK